MQIRHSYSIGSIVPFSSSTTFTSTNKNKDSSKCISYRPGPPFLTLRVQFCESHWLSGGGRELLHQRAGGSLPTRCCRDDGPSRFPRCLTDDRHQQQLGCERITNIKHTDGWKESSACLYWGELRDGTTGYGGFFGSVPERRSGH